MRKYTLKLFTIVILSCLSGLEAAQQCEPCLPWGALEPKIYSGTRLDVYAIRGEREGLGKFKAEAPEYPLLDVPFSIMLDTFILPITFPVALYETVFE